MWWRSFFLQSAWSYAFKQNLGFADLYRRLSRRAGPGTAVLVEPFNTNPVTSCFVVPFLAGRAGGAGAEPPPGDRGTGGAPDEAGAGQTEEAEFRSARAMLASSFAATGDRLVWYLLRPAAGLIGAGLGWLTQQAWVGAAGLVVAYDVPQLALRIGLWRAGRRGAPPGVELKRLQAWAERVRRAGVAAAGFLAVAVPLRGPGWGPVGVACMVAAAGGSWLVLRRWPRAGTLLAVVGLIVALSMNRGLPRVF